MRVHQNEYTLLPTGHYKKNSFLNVINVVNIINVINIINIINLYNKFI